MNKAAGLLMITVAASSCKSPSDSNLMDGTASPVTTTIETRDLGLSMNDISVLFPVTEVPGLQATLPTLGATSAAVIPQTALKPSRRPSTTTTPVDETKNFVWSHTGAELNKALPEAPNTRVFTGDLSTYRLASYRLDPCGNELATKGDDAKCIPVLRLSWQTETLKSFRVDRDSNIHTIYALSRKDLADILARKRAMHKAASIDTTPMPLRPHPVIASEGLKSPYLAEALKIVKEYAVAPRLIAVAALSIMNDSSRTWSMVQLNVKDKKFTIVPVPTIVGTEAVSNLAQKFSFEGSGADFSVFPQGTHENRIKEKPAKGGGRGGPPPADAKERTEARLVNAFAVNNPLLHDAFNIDCASCHREISTLSLQRSKESEGMLTVPATAFTSTRWNLLNETSDEVADNFTSLQMFSYVNGKFKISTRVITESAHVLDYLSTRNY